LGKHNCHRPPDRWEKDHERLGQERRKRGSGGGGPRTKKPRTKSNPQLSLTSEVGFATDPTNPADQDSSPNEADGDVTRQTESPQECQAAMDESKEDMDEQAERKESKCSSNQSQPGSTHSRTSRGTVNSPIAIDVDEQPDLGSTRRLLFPSPRKDGIPKVLSELSVNINIVQTSPDRLVKEAARSKENLISTVADTGGAAIEIVDDIEALFRSPAVARPSTPPPKETANRGPFKTPTRPTPSHRPITRSISKSIHSSRGNRSPMEQALLQRTPSKTPSRTPARTPRFSNGLGVPGSVSLRRSPRFHHHAHFEDHHNIFETPLTATINQMLSEGHDFGTAQLTDSPFRGLDIDLSSLPNLDNSASAMIDFGNLLSTDAILPSSPPGLRRPGDGTLHLDFAGTASLWAQWNTGIDGELLDDVDPENGEPLE
jgi:hypothetical protein